ncbi:MAG TPA: DUF72 domain-containing protein [candidate division Zixibacteria bacterium]|nr:DUF72 domain-containing protein [candidate division Zixibacteria bacterium]
MATASIRIGCSGWQYRHWRGSFYPADLPVDRWLEHYATEFDTVELNNSFYRLPEADAFAAWARRVPPGFTFAVKASRYLTHVRRLREPTEGLERFWSRATRLGPHLGPVLYQLPPRWHRDVDRLEAFLSAVPRGRAQAIEFRDPDWYHPDTHELLRRHEVALCLHDMAGSATRPEPIGPFVYVRFHGAGAKYGGRYPSQALAAWAERLAAWASGGLPCWVYFNNDVGGHAPRDAARLREMIRRRVA